VNPVSDVQSPRISTGLGQTYSVAWADDRLPAASFHIYIQSYGYDVNGKPTPIAGNLRVDTTNNVHSAQSPSIANHPNQISTTSTCSRLAWQDDRLNVGVKEHIYAQYMCSDGFRLFPNDLPVDQHPTDISAANAVIVFQPSYEFAVAWQAERTAGSTLQHDISLAFSVHSGYLKAINSR